MKKILLIFMFFICDRSFACTQVQSLINISGFNLYGSCSFIRYFPSSGSFYSVTVSDFSASTYPESGYTEGVSFENRNAIVLSAYQPGGVLSNLKCATVRHSATIVRKLVINGFIFTVGVDSIGGFNQDATYFINC